MKFQVSYVRKTTYTKCIEAENSSEAIAILRYLSEDSTLQSRLDSNTSQPFDYKSVELVYDSNLQRWILPKNNSEIPA